MQRTLVHPGQHQRGVALFVVLVFVMLAMLLALWASRTALFNELVVGNDADYQRAFEAAQALLQDAELDIRGERSDGLGCTSDPSNPKICRNDLHAIAQIPLEGSGVGTLLAYLETVVPTACQNGLCAKRTGPTDFWNNSNAALGTTLTQMAATDTGARYGEYTGAIHDSAAGPVNPLLQWDAATAANEGGWYWIEVLPYDESSKSSGLITGSNNTLALHMVPNVVYRITALAYGRKPGTLVVLQQTYARQKLKD